MYMYMYMYMYVYLYMYVYTCVYIYIYTYTHIYTYIYTDIHTHTPICDVQHHNPASFTTNIQHPQTQEPAQAVQNQLSHCFLGYRNFTTGAEATPTILARLQSYHLLQMPTSRSVDRRDQREHRCEIGWAVPLGPLGAPRYSCGRL